MAPPLFLRCGGFFTIRWRNISTNTILSETARWSIFGGLQYIKYLPEAVCAALDLWPGEHGAIAVLTKLWPDEDWDIVARVKSFCAQHGPMADETAAAGQFAANAAVCRAPQRQTCDTVSRLMDFKRLTPALVIVFANLIGATIILPILPLFAVDQLGGTAFQAVLLDTAYYGAKFVAAPFLGRWSDRYGRRPILILSQSGTVFSFILFILALPLGRLLDGAGLSLGLSGGLIMLYVARLLDGATGGNTIIAQAYVSDITSDEDRTQALGLLAASLGVGFIFGPAVGGFLAARWGMMAPFFGGAVIAAAALLLTIAMLQESLPVEKRTKPSEQQQRYSVGRQALANPTFLLILTIGFIATLCFAAISPTFALYADRVLFADISDTAIIYRNVGLMFTLMGLDGGCHPGAAHQTTR